MRQDNQMLKHLKDSEESHPVLEWILCIVIGCALGFILTSFI